MFDHIIENTILLGCNFHSDTISQTRHAYVVIAPDCAWYNKTTVGEYKTYIGCFQTVLSVQYRSEQHCNNPIQMHQEECTPSGEYMYEFTIGYKL